ncbi:SAV_2336 N-terminal domain-related protein [Streptomyces sp. ODS28]|uniref:SAV_2336 N-terminal domain-related protein n=1 Tax=Streptomyces sp. ODS28 TaxID=3136688 RepID=UPI0031E86433
MRDGLSELVERLRSAGVEPSATELADALWLARWTGAPAGHGGLSAPGGHASGYGLAGSGAGPLAPDSAATGDDTALSTQDPGGTGAEGASVPLHAGRGDQYAGNGTAPPRPRGGERQRDLPAATAQGFPVRAPLARVLPAPLTLQRALRPMQRYRPPLRTVRRELDEQATAERAAETGIVTPVLRSGARRAARVRILMDVSSSMAPWESMCAELRQVCSAAGVFRDVKVHFLHEDAESGEPVVGSGMAPEGGLRPAGLLRDPTGQWVTLLLSDCAGPMWRSGRMQRQLCRWAQTTPVAVLQPLPQRMWRRTHLPAQPGTLRRRRGPGGRLEFHPAPGTRDGRPGARPVPVLPPTETALGHWAQLVSGATDVIVNAAAGWVHPAHPAAARPRAAPREGTAAPREVLRKFERGASPEAVRLAVFLSATELLLPVMQLVQRAVLPATGPSELAEVLLGGLLVRKRGRGAPSGTPAYEFREGVRELLLKRLGAGEAQLVLKECSRYVERHFGTTARNFPAVAAAYLAGRAERGEAPPGAVGAPFARVSQAVLRRFLPKEDPERGAEDDGRALDRAGAHLERYEETSEARELDQAIAQLRALRPAGPDAAVLLSRALLHRWRALGMRSDLVEAYEALGGDARAYRHGEELGAVLEALASEARAADDWRELPRTGHTGPGDDRLRFVAALLGDAAGAYAASADGGDPGFSGRLMHAAALHLEQADTVRRMDADPSDEPPAEALSDGFFQALMGAFHVLDRDGLSPAAREMRGGVLLALSRYSAGEEPLSPETPTPDLAREYAADALADLEAAEPAAGSRGAADLAGYWLGRAEARRRAARDPHDDSVFGQVKAEMDAALAYAEGSGDAELAARAHESAARMHLARHRDGAGTEPLVAAARHLGLARTPLPQDGEEHVRLLVEEARVRALLASTEHYAAGGDQLGEAVGLLRRAVARTADPARCAAWQSLLASRLLERYEDQARHADLEEAEALLSQVTRSREAPPSIRRDAGRAYAEMALQHSGDSPVRRTTRAAALYLDAARAAEEADDPAGASELLGARAELTERFFGARPATAAYEQIVALWERHGAPESREAHQAREQLARLAEAGGG